MQSIVSADAVANLQQRFEKAGLDNVEPMLNLDTVADASLDVADILAVPDDDYTLMGFPTGCKEDRMVLKFRKPEGRFRRGG